MNDTIKQKPTSLSENIHIACLFGFAIFLVASMWLISESSSGPNTPTGDFTIPQNSHGNVYYITPQMDERAAYGRLGLCVSMLFFLAGAVIQGIRSGWRREDKNEVLP